MVVTMLPMAVMPVGAADETAIVAWNDVNNNAVIDNGETSYQSLQAAFKDSARAYIRLCADIQLSEQTSIYEYSYANNDFTLDLNGYQITSTAYIYLDLNVSMTVKDTSTLQTGSMTATESVLFNFYGTLTVQNGTFTSEDNIFDNNGTLIINGGEFYATGGTANLIGQNGTLTINGGEFNTSGYSVIYVKADSKSITINGGYFGKEGKWGHIYMRYTTPIDLSNHNDPNGITIKNATGDNVAISQITLPDGYFLVDPNSETATELSNNTTYSITSNTTPYTVTFDANGGSGEMENRTTLGIFELPYNGFTAPSGKIFKCWQIGDNEYESGDRVTLTDNVTVKALWLTPTVYCYDGDELLYTIEVSGDYYSFYLPAAPEAPSDEVFFAGWAIDSPDSDHIYSAGTLHQNVYATRNYYAVWIKPQAIWGADSSSLTGAGTLAEAIEAANADSSIHYIELCEDVTDAEFAINGSDITIDLNGYNISAGEYSVVFSVSSGNLTINNSQSTGGVISGDQVIANVSSGSALTVNGGTFMPLQNAYTIENQGTLTITGGTFYAKPFQAAVHTTNQNASVTLSGGDFVQESGTKGCIWYIDGILDLSDYADPAGITIYRYANWESGEFSIPADYALYLLSSGKTDQYENQTTLTICKATGHPGFDEAGCTDNGDGTHSFTCGDCGATVSDNHSGGTATCKEQAKCEHCGASYGELGGHTGGMATCTTLAVCDTCGESYGELDPNNHEYEMNNGICCDTYQSATLVTNENYESFYLKADYVGYYAISNAGQLFWYANYINTVDRTANAVLTADIDLEGRPWTPIGSTGENSHNFRGIFDGQNHTIKGLYVEGGRAGLGFFGEVRTGTVKNFTIYGEVVANTDVNYVGGVIGSICGLNGENDLERNGAIIQNITSYVNLTAKTHGIGMIGGFVGYANHESLIENCSWYGTFDAGEYRVDSGAGGFIGKIQENTSRVTIRNCGAYGTIKTNYAKNSYNNTATIYMGGFLSFSNTGAQTAIENCLFAGKFECGENLTDEARLGAFGTLRSVNAIKNCYYLGDDGLEAVHSDSPLNAVSENIELTSVTREQLKSGEVAYLLGEAWGQMSNTEGSLPIITDNELYKVVTVGETGNYSVANVGDTNGDGTVDVVDYQAVVNKALADDHEQIETASYDDIIRYDLDGDGYLDVIDAYFLHLFINGFTTVDVYAVGDYDLNGKAFEEADIFAMAEAMKAPGDLETHEKYACDINGDGKVSYDDLNTLTSMFPLYFVGEA